MKIKRYCCSFSLVLIFCITGFCQFENRVFRKIVHPKLKDFYATGVYKPEGKGIWFFSNNSGLAYFDGNDIVNFRYSANDSLSLSSDNIKALAQDSSGNLWIGTKAAGLNIINRLTGKIEKLPFKGLASSQRQENTIRAMFMDDNNNLFIGLFSKGFLIVNTATRQMKQYNIDTSFQLKGSPNLNTANSFAQDKKNKNLYWITTHNGLYVFDKLTEKTSFVFRPDENKISKIQQLPYSVGDCLIDDDNNVWFLHNNTRALCI
jgi:ligand-binding sensor domain-containing protein